MKFAVRHLPLLAVLLLALLAGTAGASEKKTIFYNVTTDESWASGMALAQASMAMQNGYKVVVFLNVRAVYLASKSRAQDTFSGSGKTPDAMLTGLAKGGARVIICPMCMQKAGITEADLVEGVELGGPPVTMPLMTGDDTVVISF